MDTRMKRRMVRVFVVLWLGWYLWGPVDPAVDWWDTPSQTMADMVRAAGGMVVLMGAGFAMARLQGRRLRDGFRLYSHATLSLVIRSVQRVTVAFLFIPAQPTHAPPVPLRI
jgi:hypothetical protein